MKQLELTLRFKSNLKPTDYQKRARLIATICFERGHSVFTLSPFEKIVEHIEKILKGGAFLHIGPNGFITTNKVKKDTW